MFDLEALTVVKLHFF